MSDAATVRITLRPRDATAVAAMAAALALPADEFLGHVVASWVEKPKRYRRLAKRLLAEVRGRAGDQRRRRAKDVARALERSRRGEDAPRAAARPATKRPTLAASA